MKTYIITVFGADGDNDTYEVEAEHLVEAYEYANDCWIDHHPDVAVEDMVCDEWYEN